MNGSNSNEGYELWVKRHKEWTKGNKYIYIYKFIIIIFYFNKNMGIFN